ncbi:hypothetical protein BJ138DRAFT_1175564 [Hygrophoropsis aurantiaca]|uniref:Uncharacterized protein n=1 Tax=Hygrophoropsis aurantiaca TaxID=72124 RepID=A0ACB8AUI7_9AGAM|nr:hypothetical protein BJ138DRAFT_1175564 [Hygrophoropsis aurantiaca]
MDRFRRAINYRRDHGYSGSAVNHRRGGGGHSFGPDRDRVAGGYKSALTNPRTTRDGRKHAKHELRRMGRDRDTHVPFITKVKRALGIRSTPRRRTALRKHTRY